MINPDQLKLDIKNALLRYPELIDDEELRADTLEGLTDLKEALTLLVRAEASAADKAEAVAARMLVLGSRKARLVHRSEGIRELILTILQTADLKKLELPEATLSQVKGQPQILGEINPDALPDDLVRIKREPNRTAIKEALLAHRELPGLSLSNAPPTLTIRVK